jgi:hypothetical protein
MKKIVAVLTGFAVLNVIAFCGCIDINEGTLGPEVRKYFDYKIVASNDTILNVNTVNGAIDITSWDGENITINATKRSRHGIDDLKNAEMQVTEDNNQITITIQHAQPIRSRAVDLDIKIPYDVTVKSASSANGPIEITKVKGNTILTTTNGAIVADAVEGYVKATTTNGGINIQNTTGIDDIISTNGGINVEVLDFIDDVSIKTTNGGISVFFDKSLNINVEISTVNGGITNSNIVNVTSSTSKSLKGTIGTGGNTINIQTTNGGINVFEL